MPTIFERDAPEHACPYDAFSPCRGSRCMAWAWTGPTVDRCETDNLVETEEGPRPVGDPTLPEGDGWQMDGAPYAKSYHRSAKDKLPPAAGQRWVREREVLKGECARHHGDQHGGYW